jgi:RNA polymerase sigma factor (sigma-70 family)
MRAHRSTQSWDAAAFEALYRRHERAVAGFLMRRTGRAELAADLTAEAFAAALIAWREGAERPANEQAWLFGIARHKLIDSYRRGQVEDAARVRLGMHPTVIDDESLSAIAALTDETPALELVAALPEPQRAAVTGRVIEERSYDELAASLGLSEQVIRKRVSRSLAQLRAAMGRPR